MPGERFGEVRSVLQMEPSLRAWFKLCHLVEGWEEETLRARVLPYVCDHLAREEWASTRRPAPRRWIERWLDGGEVPGYFSLIDTFQCRGEEVSTHHLARLVSSPLIDRLVKLELVGVGLDEPALDMLSSACCPSLREVDLSENDLAGVCTSLSRCRWLTQLESLSIASANLGDGDLINLASSTLDSLRVLDLSGNALGEVSLEILADAQLFPALTALAISDNTNLPTTSTGPMELDSLRAFFFGEREGLRLIQSARSG